MFKEIKMVGERDIDKETRRLKTDKTMINIMLLMMLNNIENASKLNEEEFYLLDCLIKCKLILVGIDIDEDYSENVKKLLEYCNQESYKKRVYNYTYVTLTENNVDILIKWLLKKGKKCNDLSCDEKDLLERLQELKGNFYNKSNDMVEWLKNMQKIEKEKVALNL